MKSGNGTIVTLLFLATCNENLSEPNATGVEATPRALGTVPPTEVAVWEKVPGSDQPTGRYLQAVAFDETRRVVVMFGGTNKIPSSTGNMPNQETWEWSPATDKWTNRTGTGAMPTARVGAAMVFDSARGKVVLFGGRAYRDSFSGDTRDTWDTWEWDPKSGAWTDVSAEDNHPPARLQHGMVYEKSTGKVLLFGGLSNSGSLGDTWEYDPATHTWTEREVTAAPSVRYALGLVWDAARAKAVLYGGSEGGNSFPPEDIWEWDPVAGVWTERTAVGAKPSARYGHAMAYDGTRKRVVVFGGYDPHPPGAPSQGASMNDLWDFEPVAGVWTQRLTGAEAGVPSVRSYASLVADDASARLYLLAGAASPSSSGSGGAGGAGGSNAGGIHGAGGATYSAGDPVDSHSDAKGTREVWELNPSIPAFSKRTPSLDGPSIRGGVAMAFSPATGKTYVFGGADPVTADMFDELWAWDGKIWSLQPAEVRPPRRVGAALAYDPVRRSLILYGGFGEASGSDVGSFPLGDTWEWDATGKWKQLLPAQSPVPLMGHAMVTDTTRGKVLLFGGESTVVYPAFVIPCHNEVWEWDGQIATWTHRTPQVPLDVPAPGCEPLIAYDEGRRKLFAFGGFTDTIGTSRLWEWDPLTAGWALSDGVAGPANSYPYTLTYDSIRRRHVMLAPSSPNSPGTDATWEIDMGQLLCYVRTPSPSPRSLDSPRGMVFDSLRGVVVRFGARYVDNGEYVAETWEYKVSNLASGEGCTAAFAASCASGNCVDGVCCDVAVCTGACAACNVPGSEGTCTPAKPGTEVAGSCAAGQACDGTGSCKPKSGQPCAAAAECASGFCADSVCCDGACTGACVSCDQAGRVGTCTPYLAGTDPQAECGQGTGLCKSICDGVGSCVYPSSAMICADGQACDGSGSCKLKNGKPCTAGAACASGFCADGVCCDDACTDTCMSCNQAGWVGACTPYPAGTDPQAECGQGTGLCKSTCDGARGCAFPLGGAYESVCGNCLLCDGKGNCSIHDARCGPPEPGRDGGPAGGSGALVPSTGGTTGSPPGSGGTTGGVLNLGGAAGGIPSGGGAGGVPIGGSGGNGGTAGTDGDRKDSGCQCTVGRGNSARPGLAVPLLAGWAVWLLARRRGR